MNYQSYSGVVNSGAFAVVIVGGTGVLKVSQLGRGQRRVCDRIHVGRSHGKVVGPRKVLKSLLTS